MKLDEIVLSHTERQERTERALALGFSERVWFHGSSYHKKFDYFDIGKGNLGPGVYLNADPKKAANYSKKIKDWKREWRKAKKITKGMWVSLDNETFQVIKTYRDSGDVVLVTQDEEIAFDPNEDLYVEYEAKVPHIRSVRARIERTLNLCGGPWFLDDDVIESLLDNGVKERSLEDAAGIEGWKLYKRLEGEISGGGSTLNSILEDNGYDSIYAYMNFEGEILVVLNPKLLRDIEAEYDPDKLDSDRLMDSIIR